MLESIKYMQKLASRYKKIQKPILVYQRIDTSIKIQETQIQVMYPLTKEVGLQRTHPPTSVVVGASLGVLKEENAPKIEKEKVNNIIPINGK